MLFTFSVVSISEECDEEELIMEELNKRVLVGAKKPALAEGVTTRHRSCRVEDLARDRNMMILI